MGRRLVKVFVMVFGVSCVRSFLCVHTHTFGCHTSRARFELSLFPFMPGNCGSKGINVTTRKVKQKTQRAKAWETNQGPILSQRTKKPARPCFFIIILAPSKETFPKGVKEGAPTPTREKRGPKQNAKQDSRKKAHQRNWQECHKDKQRHKAKSSQKTRTQSHAREGARQRRQKGEQSFTFLVIFRGASLPRYAEQVSEDTWSKSPKIRGAGLRRYAEQVAEVQPCTFLCVKACQSRTNT